MLNNWKCFVPKIQQSTVNQLLRGEEGAYFTELMEEIDKTFDNVPNLYEQDGKGKEAVLWEEKTVAEWEKEFSNSSINYELC